MTTEPTITITLTVEQGKALAANAIGSTAIEAADIVWAAINEAEEA